MATRSVSPGGALLRSSRLFSLPAPLPPPSNPYASTKWNSDTMTTPYPTHQVITTISASRENGDWGLKRPLPLKSTTKSSVAMLRVKAIDTIDQITDYASGADHGITLLKFQELGLPIVTQESKHLDRARLSVPDSRQMSVFEDDIDFTAIPDDKARGDLVDNRWRFQGPWLAGMPHGEFQKYLETKVRPRRAQFRTFLKEKIAEELNANANQNAMDQGEEELTFVRPGDITNEQVTNYLRKLREDSSNSTLYQIVGQFLDLAPLKPPPFVLDNLSKAGVEVKLSNNPYAEHGPPRTHPSAGLSYLRTKNYIDNHPIYGPQEQLKPVVARLVRPRRQVAGTEPAKFGIAGIVSDVPLGDVRSNQKTGPRGEVSIDNMDVESPGGPKIWVLPNRASIDSEGRVVLSGVMPKVEQELVAKELIGEGDGIFGKDREAEYNRVRENISLNRRRYSQITMSTPQGYGL